MSIKANIFLFSWLPSQDHHVNKQKIFLFTEKNNYIKKFVEYLPAWVQEKQEETSIEFQAFF